MDTQHTCSLFMNYPTALISDCLDRLYVLDSAIRPVTSSSSFCGPAFPVEEYAGLNCTIHLATAQLPPGYVLMINAQGYDKRAVWGGMLNLAATTREAAAIVIDGAVRDTVELRKSPFPVFARAVTTAGPLKGEIGGCNRTTSVGGIVVRPGDIVRGDEDGIVVIPQDKVISTLEACESRVRLEEAMVSFIESNKMTMLGESLL